jgi:hypothetical protein
MINKAKNVGDKISKLFIDGNGLLIRIVNDGVEDSLNSLDFPVLLRLSFIFYTYCLCYTGSISNFCI